MISEQFENLTLKEKIDIVFIQGREILQRMEQKSIVKLYRLHDFYVEIWYRWDTNRIDKIIKTTFTDVVRDYQDEIDLSGLYRKSS